MPLEIRRDSSPPTVVLTVTGELDLASIDALDSEVDAAIAADCRHLVFDLGGLTFCDSTGLGLFVRAHKRLTGRGARFSLAAVQPAVDKVIKLTGLDAALDIYPDVELARTGKHADEPASGGAAP